MTPEQIQSTIDFILRNQANSAIRMEQIEEINQKLQRKIDALVEVSHDLVRVSRQSLRRIERLEQGGL